MDLIRAWIPQRPITSLSVGFALYLGLVRLLRFQRVRALNRKYGYAPSVNSVTPNGKIGGAVVCKAGRPDVRLTPEEAQAITLDISQLEMPGLMRIALAFALFKTYSIVRSVSWNY